MATEFDLPPDLVRLIAEGVWPTAGGLSLVAQQLNPTIPSERVSRFASDESFLCLYPPPFSTVAQSHAACGAGDFWERFGALARIRR